VRSLQEGKITRNILRASPRSPIRTAEFIGGASEEMEGESPGSTGCHFGNPRSRDDRWHVAIFTSSYHVRSGNRQVSAGMPQTGHVIGVTTERCCRTHRPYQYAIRDQEANIEAVSPNPLSSSLWSTASRPITKEHHILQSSTRVKYETTLDQSLLMPYRNRNHVQAYRA
jgi:hypothetical protein